MIKTISSLSLFLMTTFLFGCVQVEPVDTAAKEKIAISTVRDSQKMYPNESLFSLMPIHAKETSLKPEQTQSIYQIYSNSIINNLEDNGFKYSANNTNIAFQVGFGVALSGDVSDEKLSQKFGLTPGLAEKDNLNKGSFIIYIQDAHTEQRIWRGAVQGFSHENLSDVERGNRVQAIVNQVMALYFQGK